MPNFLATRATLLGEINRQLTYMLVWETKAEREKLSTTFGADTEWNEIAAESERDGPIVQNSANQLLRPAAFPPMK